MISRENLLERLEAIASSLRNTNQALALMGLGSAGAEIARMDEFSDLDFFVIVRPGCHSHFLDNLDWLADAHPLAYFFMNTSDGYKVFFADGIFCEFAVFEPEGLAQATYSAGRIIWCAENIDPNQFPLQNLGDGCPTRGISWLVDEALSNLYIGLLRHHRGEKLSAARFIQGYAVDRVIELSRYIETPLPSNVDPFAPERRFELRYPDTSAYLPEMIQGYNHNRESARAILAFLEENFPVNIDVRQRILELCRAEA